MNTRSAIRWEPATPRASFLVTFAIATLVMFWQLGVRGLNEPDEGRYSSVAYEMLRSGDWLVPRFQSHMHVSKPPLSYWLEALCMKAWGVNEWAARFPSALSALAAVLLTWSLACRWFGPRRAMQTALILASTPLFFVVARLSDPNMLLTFWVTLGIWAWISWQADGRVRHRWIYYLAHGGAFLTKGPVGCVLILLAAAAFRWSSGDRLPRRRTWAWPGFLVALALGLSWYLYMILRRPELFDYFWRYELYDRVFSDVHKRGEPFWYFWWVLPLGFLPWIAVVAPLARRGRAALRRAYPEFPLLLFAAAALLLFSISTSKLPTYIVPAYPALALLTAAQLAYDEQQGSKRYRLQKTILLALALGMAPLMMTIGVFKLHWEPVVHSSNLLALLLGLTLAWAVARQRGSAWVAPAALLIFVAYAASLDVMRRHEGDLGGASTARHQIEALRQIVAADPAPVYFAHAPASLEFYLQSPEPLRAIKLTTGDQTTPAGTYAQQVVANVEAPAYVVGSTRYLQKAMAAGGLPERLKILDEGWKYSLLRVE